MTNHGSFSDGYIDGWRSVRAGTNPPGIPAYALPAGRQPYEYGFELGKSRALENQSG